MQNNIVTVHDKHFTPFISEEEIAKQVNRIAQEMNKDLSQKDPIFLGILNGAFMFASDLYKQLLFPCQITFLKLASYSGTQSTGKVKQLIGINMELKDRVVVVLEDIVDTGVTLQRQIRVYIVDFFQFHFMFCCVKSRQNNDFVVIETSFNDFQTVNFTATVDIE